MKRVPLKILVIEDNHTIALQIIDALEAHFWSVDYAANGTLGINLALTEPFDLVILDLGLPDIDGFDVCHQIKTRSSINLPILMLTARDAYDDKARGFNLGADDYVTKPFELRELILRCEALTRRQNLYQDQLMTIGDLTLDLNEHKATIINNDLSLNSIAFKILLVLSQAYPQPVSRSTIIHKIWGDNPPNSNVLKSHIYNLRTALSNSIKPPMNNNLFIKTITNVGYKLIIEGEESK